MFTILDGGNIGIRDTSPDALLEITTGGTSSAYLMLTSGATDGDILIVDSSGNIGINDSSPDYKLEVLDTSTQLTLTYADASTYTEMFTDVNGDLHIEPSGSDTYIEGQCVTGDSLLPIVELEEARPLTASSSDEFSRGRASNSSTSLKRIDEVKEGDYVLSLNQETNKIEPHRIKGLLDMGIKPVYRLTTESGKTIRTTGNHPYLAITKTTSFEAAFDDSSLAQIVAMGTELSTRSEKSKVASS